jgi:hypothetical protein
MKKTPMRSGNAGHTARASLAVLFGYIRSLKYAIGNRARGVAGGVRRDEIKGTGNGCTVYCRNGYGAGGGVVNTG